MNLAIFIRGIYPEKIGGQEVYGFLLLKNLTKLQDKVTIFTFGSLKILKKMFRIYSLKPINIPFIRFPFKILFFIISFFKHQKKLKIQIIHANGAISEGMAAVLIKKLLKIPVIVTLHGGDIYSFAKKFPFMVKYILNHADRVIAIDNFIKTLANQYTSRRIDKISNFIDLKKFKKVNETSIIEFKKKYNLTDKIMVLIVSRLVSTKGINNLIYLIRDLSKKYVNICLMIIGEGPERKNLMKLASSFRIRDKVIFSGKISNEELPIYYSACDIFIFPSLYEGQPMVILEAMACEAPIISYNVGGIPELIKNGYNGVLIPKNNYSALKDGIDHLISNTDLGRKMGKNGRKMIEKKFDSITNFRKIYHLYRLTLKSIYDNI